MRAWLLVEDELDGGGMGLGGICMMLMILIVKAVDEMLCFCLT